MGHFAPINNHQLKKGKQMKKVHVMLSKIQYGCFHFLSWICNNYKYLKIYRIITDNEGLNLDCKYIKKRPKEMWVVSFKWLYGKCTRIKWAVWGTWEHKSHQSFDKVAVFSEVLQIFFYFCLKLLHCILEITESGDNNFLLSTCLDPPYTNNFSNSIRPENAQNCFY